MSDPAALLRMLEPAVRPVPTPAGGTPAARLPVEEQDFASLLAELGDEADEDTEEVDPSAEPGKGTSPLAPLTQLDAIENPSLRTLIAGRGEANQHTGPADPRP